jgi:hypothetical protein
VSLDKLIQRSDTDREQTECEAGKAAALGNHRAMSMDEEVTIDDSTIRPE